jgi:Choline dehydrogenase and related flavoproteins
MATRLKHRTVVFVGGGFTAALAARQLTAKGVDVVVLERGIDRTHTAATSLPSQRDELRWDVHGDLFQDWSVQTYTLRHNDGETALPIRRLQAFKPGEGMGGAANHWNGQTWRWSESDPVLRTHLTEPVRKEGHSS